MIAQRIVRMAFPTGLIRDGLSIAVSLQQSRLYSEPSPCLLTGEGVGSLSVTEGNATILKVAELKEDELRESER
jgi:hypothetical protein